MATVTGNSLNNTLTGTADADTLKGGFGNDIYIVDNVGDIVDEGHINETLLLSATQGQVIGDSDSENSAISGNGRLVFFESGASNLAGGEALTYDIFAKDTVTGEIFLVSKNLAGTAGNSSSFLVDSSADGRYVSFGSYSSNLATDTNGGTDIYVKDLATGSVTLASTHYGTLASGYRVYSENADISDDGAYVVYESQLYHQEGENYMWVGPQEVFLKNMKTGATTTIAEGGNAEISGNNRYVVFESRENLSSSDADNDYDVYRKDLQTGELTLVSTNSPDNADSENARISADGRYIVYSNSFWVPGYFEGYRSIVYLRDMQTGTVEQISEDDFDGYCGYADISRDGRYVVFEKGSAVYPERSDIYVKDLQTGELKCVSTTPEGEEVWHSYRPQFSADGRFIVFESSSNRLVDHDIGGITDIFRVTNPFFTGNSDVDTVKASIDYVLKAAIENLVLTGTAALDGTGNNLNNVITGNAGANALKGMVGTDTLNGLGGKDSLFGGSGADNFRFSSALNAGTNVDIIQDFAVNGGDVIQLDNAVFKKLAATGALSASFFRANTTGNAADGNDYIIYETDTGKLFYDADGNGSIAKIQFALVGATNHVVITAADFAVI